MMETHVVVDQRNTFCIATIMHYSISEIISNYLLTTKLVVRTEQDKLIRHFG